MVLVLEALVDLFNLPVTMKSLFRLVQTSHRAVEMEQVVLAEMVELLPSSAQRI